jgi:hypothetical protein
MADPMTFQAVPHGTSVYREEGTYIQGEEQILLIVLNIRK